MRSNEKHENVRNEFSQQDNGELLMYVFRLENLLFTKTDSYRFIASKRNGKCLNPKEIQLLNKDIYTTFNAFIQIITNACPLLTKEDIVFCCLVRSGLDRTIAGLCMGTVNRQALHQRKYRIKKKMAEVNRTDLFELVFGQNIE